MAISVLSVVWLLALYFVEENSFNLLSWISILFLAEREELGLYIDRLVTRCLTVDINIQTIRTPAQEESLRKVKGYLCDLIDTMQANLEQSSQRVKLYLNSCLAGAESESGPVDDRFQGALLGCAAEDQKMIRKKLQEIKESLSETDAFMARLQALKLDL